MMKFSINKDALSGVLKKIISVCEIGPNSLPHFFHIRFDGYSEGHVKLTAANSVRRVEVLLEAKNHENFCFGLSGPYLNEVVKDMPRGDIEFDLMARSCNVRIERSSFTFKTLPAERFPQHPELEAEDWIEVDLPAVFGAMSMLTYCCPKKEGDNPRIWARAVVIAPGYIACSDGFRMSVIPNNYLPCNDTLMLPVDSFNNFNSVFSDIDAKGYTTIEEASIHFSSAKTYVVSRLLAGTAPNFGSVIPTGPCLTCGVEKQPLMRAIKRASVVCGMGLKPVYVASISITKDLLGISVYNDGNRCAEYVDCWYEGDNFAIDLNLKFLGQAVKAVNDANIIMEFRGKELSVVVTDEKGVHKNVILPVRSQN